MKIRVLLFFSFFSGTVLAQSDTLMDWNYYPQARIVPKYDDVYNSGFESFFVELDSLFKVKLRKELSDKDDSTSTPFMMAMLCVEPNGRVSRYRLLDMEFNRKLYYVDTSTYKQPDLSQGYVDSTKSKKGHNYVQLLWDEGLIELKKYPWEPAYFNEEPVRSWHLFAIDFSDYDLMNPVDSL
jgi:hypothetical protein